MRGFGDYDNYLKKYCEINKCDYLRIKSLHPVWGIDSLELFNDTNDLIISIEGYMPGKIKISATEKIEDFQLKG